MRSRTIVVSLLTFILVFILAACGSDSSQAPDGDEPVPDIQPVEDPILVVESERLVTDIIGDERALRAMISPDLVYKPDHDHRIDSIWDAIRV